MRRDELLAVGRGEEEAAALVVAEELDREQCEPPRLLEPAQLAGRDVQLVEPVRDVGVVVEEAGTARLPVAPGCGRAARPAEIGPSRNSPSARPPSTQSVRSSRRARLGQRRRARGRSRRRSPCRRGPAAGGCARISSSRARVAGSSSPRRIEAAVLERLEQLLGRALAARPRVRQPLDAVGVRVLRRGEAAARAARRSRSRYSTVSSTTSR